MTFPFNCPSYDKKNTIFHISLHYIYNNEIGQLNLRLYFLTTKAMQCKSPFMLQIYLLINNLCSSRKKDQPSLINVYYVLRSKNVHNVPYNNNVRATKQNKCLLPVVKMCCLPYRGHIFHLTQQLCYSLFVICKNEKSAYNRTDYGTPCILNLN